ncbi:MAG: nucleoside 2-deoxyribosyltransferase [Planctomycetes bacterium]|nr:nucleoside 2-deoxyribosyltransferase [Planctomycetota bacterium]
MFERNDFRRLRSALMLEGVPDRCPLIELHVNPQVQAAYLGRPIESAKDLVEFWMTAGYDYVPAELGLIQVGGVFSGDATTVKKGGYSVYSEEDVEMNWAAEHKGIVTNLDEFERFNWPTVDSMDFSILDELASLIPEQVKIIAILGKVFTAAWMLMGFETFAMATVEGSDLMEPLFQRIGELQYGALARAMECERVGAAWMSDDIAFGTGLMVKPEVLRRYVFPWYQKMGELCREKDLPFIYHSDGRLFDVLEDLIDVGFNALHPIEPKAMDSRELKEIVTGELCLLGNVEVDRLSRGTPEEVRQIALDNIRDLAYDGGYCLGSSNSVTSYVPVENYRAMIKTVFE